MADAAIVLCGFVIAWCLMISFRLMNSKQLESFSKVNASIKMTSWEREEDRKTNHNEAATSSTTSLTDADSSPGPTRVLQVVTARDPEAPPVPNMLAIS